MSKTNWYRGLNRVALFLTALIALAWILFIIIQWSQGLMDATECFAAFVVMIMTACIPWLLLELGRWLYQGFEGDS